MGRIENLNELALELGCQTSELQTTCSELLLGVLYNFMAAWDKVKERFCKR